MKIPALLLIPLLAFTFLACSSGSTNGSSGTPDTTGTTDTTADTTDPTDTTDTATGSTAAELVAKMGIGWNLGNSLDAPTETGWSNPAVTQALLNEVKSAGFTAVRIPVSWYNHLGSSPSYTINSTWLSRVKEVVGYAQNAGLYVIINIHHDGANSSDTAKISTTWLSLVDANLAVTDANNTAVETEFKAVWTQIATAFKDYDETLLFESMNEIHFGYSTPLSSYYTIINTLNQDFVTLVRATGGNNISRSLIIPGYNTNIDYTVAHLTLPTDTVANRLIVTCHFYDPWTYAGAGTTHYWGSAYSSLGIDSWGQESYVVSEFNKLKTTYIDKGVPVILGEYGAVNQTGYEAYRRYYMEYVTTAAHLRGIVPFYWDNNASGSGSEAFGLIRRSDNSVYYPTLLAAMLSALEHTALTDIEAP